MKAEINYSQKDAARHIVADNRHKQKLRESIMNDVLAMTGNKQLSERSKKSLASRFSNVSARRAADTVASPKNNLAAIKEEEP